MPPTPARQALVECFDDGIDDVAQAIRVRVHRPELLPAPRQRA